MVEVDNKQTLIAEDQIHQLKFARHESFVVLGKSATRKLEAVEGLLATQQ
jgi:hypothetical protein